MIGGYASNTKAARTGTSSTSGTNTNSTRRVLTPGQVALNGTLMSAAIDRITNPAAVAEPLRAAARERVNANYAGRTGPFAQEMRRRAAAIGDRASRPVAVGGALINGSLSLSERLGILAKIMGGSEGWGG